MFKQPSTYQGLTILAGVLGASVSPEMQEVIIQAVGVIYAFIMIFLKKD
jgi:hypothetical protein